MIQEHTDMTKPPFSSYTELMHGGVEVTMAEEGSDMSSLVSQQLAARTYDCVIDNWTKSAPAATAISSICDAYLLQQCIYISSAGIYKEGPLLPLVETDTVLDKGTRSAETVFMAAHNPYTIFRPQYIYGGTKASKRYLDYFIAPAVEEKPVAIPAPGEQLVCLTHVSDVAAMIIAAILHPSACDEVFNCGTDRYVTYRGLCEMAHRAAGSELAETAALYDPLAADQHSNQKPGFPFRDRSFVTSPGKARRLLGWAPRHALAEDLISEVQDFLFLQQRQ
jgi:nucleoside-diphosphate-sugar epimerase